MKQASWAVRPDANVSTVRRSTSSPESSIRSWLGSAALFLLGPLVPGIELGRTQTLVFIAAALLVVPVVRTVVRAAVNRRSDPSAVLIVGSGRWLGCSRASSPSTPIPGRAGGVHRRGLETPPRTRRPSLSGHVDDFETTCHTLAIERVVIAFLVARHEDLLGVVRMAKQLNLKVTVVPRLFEEHRDSVEIEQIEGLTLLGLRGLARTKSSLRLKRALDIALSGAALALLTPLLAIAVLAIKPDVPRPGPVPSAAHRRGDKPFTMLKFRTMHEGADEQKDHAPHINELDGPMFKIAGRSSRDLGRPSPSPLLDRRAPQLWNVLRGEMSLVGRGRWSPTRPSTSSAATALASTRAGRDRALAGHGPHGDPVLGDGEAGTTSTSPEWSCGTTSAAAAGRWQWCGTATAAEPARRPRGPPPRFERHSSYPDPRDRPASCWRAPGRERACAAGHAPGIPGGDDRLRAGSTSATLLHPGARPRGVDPQPPGLRASSSRQGALTAATVNDEGGATRPPDSRCGSTSRGCAGSTPRGRAPGEAGVALCLARRAADRHRRLSRRMPPLRTPSRAWCSPHDAGLSRGSGYELCRSNRGGGRRAALAAQRPSPSTPCHRPQQQLTSFHRDHSAT